MDLFNLLPGFVRVVLSTRPQKIRIEDLQIRNSPAMGSLSLNVVFGRFYTKTKQDHAFPSHVFMGKIAPTAPNVRSDF